MKPVSLKISFLTVVLLNVVLTGVVLQRVVLQIRLPRKEVIGGERAGGATGEMIHRRMSNEGSLMR